MKTFTDESENSPLPHVHSEHIRQQISELIEHLKADIGRVPEPRFQALLATSAEVLRGLQQTFAHYEEHNEPAWQLPELPDSDADV